MQDLVSFVDIILNQAKTDLQVSIVLALAIVSFIYGGCEKSRQNCQISFPFFYDIAINNIKKKTKNKDLIV